MASEKRLIDANTAIKEMNAVDIHFWEDAEDGVKKCVNILHNAPTVDAVEVVHGMWLWYTDDIYTCSNCYEKVQVKEVMGQPDYHYCPNCGAKMDGERRTDNG